MPVVFQSSGIGRGIPPLIDATPDQFTFTDQSGVALSSVITSAPVTITGINTAATISSSGGTFDINGSGTFISSGTVNNNNTVRARVTSSSSNSTATNCVVTIGGVSDTFTATTTTGSGLAVVTSSLSAGVVGTAYSAALSATGGTGPYVFSIVSAFPNYGQWLWCDGASLLGTPQMDATVAVVVQVTDSTGATAVSGSLSLAVSVSGSLAFVTNATLSNATNNGYFSQRVIMSGGYPPYSFSSTQTQPWQITPQGWISGTPTSTGSVPIVVTCTDSSNATASRTFTTTVDSTLRLGSTDSERSTLNLPPANVGKKYSHIILAYGGTAPYTYAVSSGSLPAGLTLSSAGVITGTPTKSGAVTCSIRVTDNVAATSTSTGLITVGNNTAVSRPSFNSSASSGLFVSNGILYDKNGYEFRWRGLNRAHYDEISWASGVDGAYTQTGMFRLFLYSLSGSVPFSTYATICSAQGISNGIVPVPSIAIYPPAGGGGYTSGDSDPVKFQTAVDWWVANVSLFTSMMDKICVNIINEYQPTSNSTYVSLYNSAVSQMRSAGYTCPLQIDSSSDHIYGGYSQQVADADPLHNCIFSYHLYGATSDSNVKITNIQSSGSDTIITMRYAGAHHPFSTLYPGNDWTGYTKYVIGDVQGMTNINGRQNAGSTNHVGGSSPNYTVTLFGVNSSGWPAYTGGGWIAKHDMSSVSNYQYLMQDLASVRTNGVNGVNVCIGEFGPGKNVGASPTTVCIEETVTAAESQNIPWTFWAWDDSRDWSGWFSSIGSPYPATYTPTNPSVLASDGMDIVLNPRFGLTALSSKADVFL